MRGLYAHASQQMREDLTAALQDRWEQSLRERAALDPHSPVPLLDNLLAQFRTGPDGYPRPSARAGPHRTGRADPAQGSANSANIRQALQNTGSYLTPGSELPSALQVQ